MEELICTNQLRFEYRLVGEQVRIYLQQWWASPFAGNGEGKWKDVEAIKSPEVAEFKRLLNRERRAENKARKAKYKKSLTEG